jgi:preprotein translocase subunit Sec61beta
MLGLLRPSLKGFFTRRTRLFCPERFRTVNRPPTGMSSGQNSGGLMSSAGLVRYFDAEGANTIKMDPKTVLAFGAFFGIVIRLLTLVSF